MAHLMLEESVGKLDWGLEEELSVWLIHMAGIGAGCWLEHTQFSALLRVGHSTGP